MQSTPPTPHDAHFASSDLSLALTANFRLTFDPTNPTSMPVDDAGRSASGGLSIMLPAAQQLAEQIIQNAGALAGPDTYGDGLSAKETIAEEVSAAVGSEGTGGAVSMVRCVWCFMCVMGVECRTTGLLCCMWRCRSKWCRIAWGHWGSFVCRLLDSVAERIALVLSILRALSVSHTQNSLPQPPPPLPPHRERERETKLLSPPLLVTLGASNTQQPSSQRRLSSSSRNPPPRRKKWPSTCRSTAIPLGHELLSQGNTTHL